MKQTPLILTALLGLLLLLSVPELTSAQRGSLRPTPSGTPGAPALALPQATLPARPGRATRTPIDTSSLPDSLPTLALSFPTLNAPLPSAEAQTAISQFNNDHLGAAIQIVYAGSATGSIEAVMQYLPADVQAAMLSASSISSATYWATLSNGAAMVAVGDCASNPAACAVSADGLSIQLSSAAAGLYGLLVDGSAASSQAALSLILATFPRLSGLSFLPISDVETGYGFSAVTATMGYDPTTRQPISVAEVVYAGTVSVSGKTFVYALAALGQGYVGVVGF